MVTPPVPSRRQVVNPVRPGREQRQQRTRAPGCGWSGRLQLPPERCPSGLRSTPGKCVWVNSPSRVRLEPPPGGERTRRRRSRRAAPKGVSRRRRRIIPPSPPPASPDRHLPHSLPASYDTPRDEGDHARPATTSCESRHVQKERRKRRTRVPGFGWPGFLQSPPERCPSGRRSTPGKCVWVNSSSRVRIPPSPPLLQ